MLVIEASRAQTRAQRRTGTALAALGWLVWAALWAPLATLAAWAFLANRMFASAREELARHIGTIAWPFGVGLGLGALLLGWALYNRVRFGRARRAREAPPAPAHELAREMHLHERQLRRCWRRRRIVAHHDEHGRLVMLEASVRQPRLAPRRR